MCQKPSEDIQVLLISTLIYYFRHALYVDIYFYCLGCVINMSDPGQRGSAKHMTTDIISSLIHALNIARGPFTNIDWL